MAFWTLPDSFDKRRTRHSIVALDCVTLGQYLRYFAKHTDILHHVAREFDMLEVLIEVMDELKGKRKLDSMRMLTSEKA